ncbi:hypothetical protein ACOMICROBIO_NCLOACGD_02895 [Vibrio sp. B1ASS3]|nr:hypothetical protein ACOMICROBIO_NCLOACGD_02895 [Vibrio sp. B1ASS3]CAE6923327.1 hypothetical protein ACOMICROBIO_NCLOACGD_02895 [Vibrio sp. B1ASS3]
MNQEKVINAKKEALGPLFLFFVLSTTNAMA